MATRADFSTAEWRTVRNAPHWVMAAATTASGSGLLGTLKETIAPAGALVEALKGNNPLLRAICDQEEMRAAVEEVRQDAQSIDAGEMPAYLQQQAVGKSRAALAIVQARRGTDDAKAYAGFLMDLAQRVTRAASEGGILGFGGERVSEGERVFLSELTEALGWPGERTFAA